MFYKINNNLAPVYLQDLLPPQVQDRTHYPLRNRDNLDVPRTRIGAHTKSFFPMTTKDWNELPNETKDAPTFKSFKRRVERGSKPTNSLYYHGKRRPSVHHTRMRMGCSGLRKHLHDRIHVVDSPTCACGTEDEDPYHFLFVCPIYAAHRITMLETINPIIYPSLRVVLHGEPSLPYEANMITFNAVHNFIEQTRRFY
jgi:hypothetical protein